MPNNIDHLWTDGYGKEWRYSEIDNAKLDSIIKTIDLKAQRGLGYYLIKMANLGVKVSKFDLDETKYLPLYYPYLKTEQKRRKQIRIKGV